MTLPRRLGGLSNPRAALHMVGQLGLPTGVAAVGVTAVASVLGGRTPTPSLLSVVFVLALLCSSPLVSELVCGRRLQSTSRCNNVRTALAWVALVLFACAWVGAPLTRPTLAFTAYVLVHAAISTIVRDLETEHGDRRAGIRTVPTLCGRTGTLQLVERINLGVAFVVVALVVVGIWPSFMLILALVSAGSIHAYLRYLDRPGARSPWCSRTA